MRRRLYVLVKNLEGANYGVDIYKSKREAEREFREYTGFRLNEKYCDPKSEEYDKRFGETKLYEVEMPEFLKLAVKKRRKSAKSKAQFDGFEYRGPKVRTKLVIENKAKYEPRSLCCARDVYEMFKRLGESDRERFYAVLLDAKNKVIGVELVSQGTLDYAPVAPNEAYKSALLASAASVIFVHGHPSGDPTPSPHDKMISIQLDAVGKLLNVKMLDHVIIGRNRYFSFADSGLIGGDDQQKG